eukprot:scaffold13476_cov174-Amphora_coffeaeformis.AAC.1
MTPLVGKRAWDPEMSRGLIQHAKIGRNIQMMGQQCVLQDGFFLLVVAAAIVVGHGRVHPAMIVVLHANVVVVVDVVDLADPAEEDRNERADW